MTLQDSGSLGELVGAIATVATLAYLAVQIRSNTHAVRSSAAQSVHESFATWYRMLAGARVQITAGPGTAIRQEAHRDAADSFRSLGH